MFCLWYFKSAHIAIIGMWTNALFAVHIQVCHLVVEPCNKPGCVIHVGHASSMKYLYHQLIGPWEIWMKFHICNFQMDFSDWWLRHSFWNCPNMNVTGLHWWSVNIDSGMAWCCQATSHYLSQCWPKSLSPYGTTWPQWVNIFNKTFKLQRTAHVYQYQPHTTKTYWIHSCSEPTTEWHLKALYSTDSLGLYKVSWHSWYHPHLLNFSPTMNIGVYNNVQIRDPVSARALCQQHLHERNPLRPS